MSTFITHLDVGAGTKVAVKDLIDVAGVPTTAGCRALADLAAPAERDAACLATISELVAAGSLRLVGKVNLHELAYGITGRNPWFGTPTNPADPRRVPGGSSSGSAAAVAAGDADVALGTDTGGSVRIPAACCAVVGLKTTWGRVSLEGVWPLAPSLDTVGPMARDVAGVATGMRLLEPGFSPAAAADVVSIGRLRLGADPAIDAAVDDALRRAGLSVADVDIPGWREAWQAANDLLSAEAWRSDRALLESSPDGVSDDVAARVRAGASVSAAREAATRTAQTQWRAHLAGVFERTQLLAMPTLAEFPPALDVGRWNGTQATLPVNFAGLPALSVPVPTAGFPASLQLVGPLGGEELLVAAGALIESAVS